MFNTRLTIRQLKCKLCTFCC